ncbi:hypothetical protein GL174_14145 [Sphingobium sp. CAP-1]|nr:hypothetical protein GL174_14145 [Sphingobium sp. CAP-1]
MNRPKSLAADAGILFLWSWGFAILGYLLRGKLSVIEALGAAIVIFLFSLLFLIGRRKYENRLNSAIWVSGILALAAAIGNFRA